MKWVPVLICLSSAAVLVRGAEPAKNPAKPTTKTPAAAVTPAKTPAKPTGKSPVAKATTLEKKAESPVPAPVKAVSADEPASSPPLSPGGSLSAPSLAIPTVPTPAKPSVPARKLETYLLLAEPKAMRSSLSVPLAGSLRTVFSPAREISRPPGIELYTVAEFAKLGISIDAFQEKAKEAAERLLVLHRPEMLKDSAGRVRYAVYRGEQQYFPCLLIAPSLAKVFENVFGKEMIAAMPDRNSFYVFPPNAAVVDDFSGDLENRYETNPWSASNEVFRISADGKIEVMGSFSSE